MELTDLIGRVAGGRVLVVGSLPPAGRDLDLLVRPAEARALEAGLAELGFERRGRISARFTGCGAEVVDMAPAGSWNLPAGELEALFAEATPIEASGHLCRPAPHHALLVLARRAMREGPLLRERRRERIADELSRDPAAFEAARSRAPAWGARRAVEALQRAYRSGEPIPRVRRRQAIAEQLRVARGRPGALIGSWRAVLRRPRRGAVIAFSGLDGSGKSSQATALAETLDRLGWDTSVVWSSVAFYPRWLGRGARALKRALARGRAREAPLDPAAGAAHESQDPGQILRARSTVLTFGWSMVVSAVLALEVLRKTWPPLLRGEVVICDRYLLDAWSHLLYQYGERRSYRVQLGLLRAVFPRPARAYLLDVPPDVAAGRKPEFSAAQNARRAAIYREMAGKLGVVVLDGSLPIDELCAAVARDAWEALA